MVIAAVTESIDLFDVLVSKNGLKLKELPYGAKIGTSMLFPDSETPKERWIVIEAGSKRIPKSEASIKSRQGQTFIQVALA